MRSLRSERPAMTDDPDDSVAAEAALAATRRFVELVLTEAFERGELTSGTVPEVIGVRTELLAALALVLDRNDGLDRLSELLEQRGASRH